MLFLCLSSKSLFLWNASHYLLPLLSLPVQNLMNAGRLKIKKNSAETMESVIILLGVIGAIAQLDTPIITQKRCRAQVSVRVTSIERPNFIYCLYTMLKNLVSFMACGSASCYPRGASVSSLQ